MSKLLVGSATDVGLVRSNNQDQMLVAPGLYAVADGMGGHAAGEVASATAVRALRAAFEASNRRSPEALRSSALAANRAVWEQAQSHRGMHGMGTTLVSLAVVERDDGTSGLAVAHIGDSRVYLLRDESFSQLTVDHSLVQELVDDGQISLAQAAVHPQRHVLTRALGVEPSVEVDLLDIDSRHGDRYLLCSDGLPREASDEDIAGVLRRFSDPTEAARELVQLALTRGGSDNVTVVVIDVQSDGGSPEGLLSVGETERAQDWAITAPRRTVTTLQPATTAQPTATEDRPRQLEEHEATRGPARGWQGQRDGGHHRRVHRGEPPEHEGRPERQKLARPRPGAGGWLSHLLTWRLAGFVAALCFVIGGAIGAVAWYARSAYFVALARGKITVFQGRPGGVLWFQPTVAERTSYTSASVLAADIMTLRSGEPVPTISAARRYISNLVAMKVEAERQIPASAKGPPRSGKASSTNPASR